MEQRHPDPNRQVTRFGDTTINGAPQNSMFGSLEGTMHNNNTSLFFQHNTYNIPTNNGAPPMRQGYPQHLGRGFAPDDSEAPQHPRKRPRFALESDNIYNPGFVTAGYGAPAAQWQPQTFPQPQPYYDQPPPAHAYTYPDPEGFGGVSTAPFDGGYGSNFNAPLYMPSNQYASYAEGRDVEPQHKHEHEEGDHDHDAQDEVPPEYMSVDGSPLQSNQVDDDATASPPTIRVSMHIPGAEPAFFHFSIPADHPLLTQGMTAPPAHYDRDKGVGAVILRSAQTLQAPSNSNPQTAIQGGAVQPAPSVVVQPQAIQGASSANATPSTTSATPSSSINNPALVQGPTHVSENRTFTVIQLPNTFSDGTGLLPADSDMIKETLPVRSLNKLATAWRKHQDIAGGHEIFDRLPAGYHLYKKKRMGGNGVEKVDPWIVGHPRGNFKSIPKFIPHFIRIMEHRNSGGCGCELCGRGRT